MLELPQAYGIGPKWLGWIKLIVMSSKVNFLVNKSQFRYIKYLMGLGQRDHLSPFLFKQVSGILIVIFNHALSFKVLHGVSLGPLGKMYHLQYADDLLVLIVGDVEDLGINKHMLYLYKAMYGMAIYFHKTSIYKTTTGQIPEDRFAQMLSCSIGLLPLTYLGVPISARLPILQD